MSSRLRGVALATASLLPALSCRSSIATTKALEAAPAVCVPSERASPAGSRVDLHVAEWAVDTVGALQEGTVQLRTHNDTGRSHRLALVRQGPGVEFTSRADGTLDVDNLPASAWVSEVAVGAPGQSCATTVEITPGDYVVFCVIVDPDLGAQSRHWSNGMVRAFRVQA